MYGYNAGPPMAIPIYTLPYCHFHPIFLHVVIILHVLHLDVLRRQIEIARQQSLPPVDSLSYSMCPRRPAVTAPVDSLSYSTCPRRPVLYFSRFSVSTVHSEYYGSLLNATHKMECSTSKMMHNQMKLSKQLVHYLLRS